MLRARWRCSRVKTTGPSGEKHQEKAVLEKAVYILQKDPSIPNPIFPILYLVFRKAYSFIYKAVWHSVKISYKI